MTFRANSHKSRIKFNQEFYKDIQWFLNFLTLHLDASLTGLGVIWNNRVYSTPIIQIPDFDLNIVHLEMWNIVIALKMWGQFWSYSSLTIYCDNLAVVQVIHSHNTKDPLVTICAQYDISGHLFLTVSETSLCQTKVIFTVNFFLF